jgi:hypothetical protein
MNAKELNETAELLFGKRSTLLSLWQEQSDNFYPERADFTYQRTLGTDFAANLMSSYPVVVRRELADQLTTMLRPSAKAWFHLAVVDPQREDNEAKRWMQWAENTQRRAMYDNKTMFTRATKEGDNDFACFGQLVMSVRLNKFANALLYRTHHLRDCAWMEDEEGAITMVVRKWKPYARDLERMFGSKVHPRVAQFTKQNKPFEEIECVHMVVASDMYSGDIDSYERDAVTGSANPSRRQIAQGEREKYPYVHIVYDRANLHLIEAKCSYNKEYIIPRWQTVSGSQYAFSPATVAGLPEARLIQAMAYTLLEAGEKVTNPPMIATVDVVRSDMAIYAGGTTWIDRDYDERMGDALRPMNIDAKGMPLGLEMLQDSRQMLAQCFYLNKLTLPVNRPEMTAYEVGQYVAEYIRNAMPIFEPMEQTYNGQMCEVTFDILRRGGAFGNPMDMPPILQGADLQFRFESPLHDAIESQKGQKFLEMKGLIAEAVTMDQSAAALPDVKVALRDALDGIMVPAKWVRGEVTVQQIEDQQKAAQAAEQTLAAMQQSSEVVKNLTPAIQAQAEAA